MRAESRSSRRMLAAALAAAVALPTIAQERRLTMWGTPPREKPHRTKAAEGFPPLPLPVVPQRRTEKKRPPAAPKLLANVEWTIGSVGGDAGRYTWKGSPGAVDQLLRSAKKHLNVWYGWEQLDMGALVRKHTAAVEHRTPILYLCVYYPLRLTGEQRDALRSYVLSGGTLIINCCGQDEAFASARGELATMFPKYTLRPLPPDHPVYHAYYDIEEVRYPVPASNPLDEGAEEVGPPRLQAVTLGTRAAAIVSREDLACGWNQWSKPDVKRVHAEDATRLGLNLITYVMAENRYAKYLSKTRTVTGPRVRPRQQLVFAQLIHDGNWNPSPSAVPLLLKELASNTSIAVQFERKTLQLKDPTLFEHPLLYMTGSWDPGLTRQERALLRRYLTNGGVLLVDAAAGRQEFDVAFRGLCEELFPEQPLTPLPADHLAYKCFYTIDKVRLHHETEPVAPSVEAIMLGDRPLILYSRFGLSDGWAHQFSAYARCYTTEDALKLGTNLVVYVMQ
ncbi:MAG: DUF4159 domain-containing protein [Phycisphaerae bacterium]